MAALRKAENLPPWSGAKAPFPPHRNWLAPAKAYRHQRRLPIDTVVIHATAGGSSAGAMSVMAHGTASWHVLIPDEDEKEHGQYLWRCVTDAGAAWHVLAQCKHPADGKTNINDRAFGVEVVNWQDGRDQFSDWQLRVTAQWVRYCWSHYGIKYLYTHAYLDPSRKSDPGTLFNWNKFMGYVREGVAAGPAPAGVAPPQAPPLIIRPNPQGNPEDIVAEGKLLNGTLYGPVRAIAAAMGGDVKWVDEQGKAYPLSQT